MVQMTATGMSPPNHKDGWAMAGECCTTVTALTNKNLKYKKKNKDSYTMPRCVVALTTSSISLVLSTQLTYLVL